MLVIDDQRLRDEAWQAFEELRRRLEAATGELHQHEEVDVPAFEAWKHRTFPLHLTALREIEREVFTKARRVEEAEARAVLPKELRVTPPTMPGQMPMGPAPMPAPAPTA